MEKYKLFYKIGDNPKRIYDIPYNDSVDYYSFLQNQFDTEYHQVIISSEAMIALMREVTDKEHLKVYNIELAEDDSAFKMEVDNLINLSIIHKIEFNVLADRLYFLAEDSSIEIKRVYFNGRTESKKIIEFFLQSNGIVGYKAENGNLLSKVNSFLQKFLFGQVAERI